MILFAACWESPRSSASTLTATFGGSRPNLAMFKPGETVPMTFVSTGASGETLTVTINDAEGNQVSSNQYPVTTGTNTLNAYNSKLGFYRVYGSLTDGTQAAPKYVTSVPSNLTSYAGPMPGNYVTYAIVPDPSTRIASIPESQAFFGMQGGFSSSVSTDLFAFLGLRWILDAQWEWKRIEPYANQRNTFASNPGTANTWATNGSGGSWTLYSIPNMTKDGRPYAGTPDVYIPGTFAYNTGALSSTYYTDWQNFNTHVAQNWPSVYPSRTQKYYEFTWEPIPTWGYNGTPAQLVTLYQLGYQAMHAADSKAIVLGPCMDVDRLGSLSKQYDDFNAGLADYIDAFSAHPYMENDAGWDAGFFEPEMAGQPGVMETMKLHLRSYTGGYDMNMLGTEQGWRTRQTLANEINQARRMVRANLIMLGEGWKVNTAFYFTDYPTTDNLNQVKYWDWGLFYNLDPGTSGGYGGTKVMPKPVAPAYAAMTSLVEGRQSVNKVNWLGDSTRGYVYESYTNSSDEVLALWDFASQHTVTVNTGVASVDVYDWMGNKTTMSTSGGNLTVTVSNEPIYIKGVASSLWGSARSQTDVAFNHWPANTNAGTSGDSSSSTPGSLAVDGAVWSSESCWVSGSNANAKWLSVDLRGNCTISEIRFFTGVYAPGTYGSNSNFYNSPFSSYHLQRWNSSNSTWSDIVYRTGNTHAAVDEVFSPVTTSKVRLYLDAGVTTQASLYELQTIGASAGPVITLQPVSQTVNAGSQLSLRVTGTSSLPVTYQWYKNGAPLTGKTLYLYYNSSVTTADAGQYYAVVTDSNGSTTTAVAQVTVSGVNNIGPIITSQPPLTQTVSTGSQLSIRAGAISPLPVTYQWYKNGTALTGQTLDVYYVSSVTSANAGQYYVVITDSNGSTTSAVSQVIVQ